MDGAAEGAIDPTLLERMGDPDPARSAAEIVRAVGHEDLAGTRERWLPSLLLTARPGFAAHALADLADRYRTTRHRPLGLERLRALPLVLGSSDFLARLLLRHPHWVEELSGEMPAAPAQGEIDPEWTAIRIAKYKGLLRIAARDLLGRDFAESPRELSDLADECLDAALRTSAIETGVAPPSLLALGKLGGRELNFSSDVDVLFVYEPPAGPPDHDAITGATRVIQTFKRHLEVASEDGFAYRVDLDLRPEGRQGVLVNSVDAALTYYETFGADWERQALVRLRYVAGPPAPALTLCRELAPFVYRSLIDPGAIRAVHAMKMRIESERRTAGRDLEADLKEGPGGIRDIEFLTQALQLFSGGREADLRTGNVLEALVALGRHGLLPPESAAALRECYLWLRRAEHCVQLVEERQTQRFPREPKAQLGLARRMGYPDPEGKTARERLLDDWTRVRAEVRMQFENLILGEDP